MAGWGMELDEEALDKKWQVVSNFLQNCYLCREGLEGKEIFMYSERAFCSEECRSLQIEMDEHPDRVYQVSPDLMNDDDNDDDDEEEEEEEEER